MKKIIGYIKKQNGKYRAESPDGEVRELKENEPIYEGDAVFFETENQSISTDNLPKIEILLNNGKEVSFSDDSYILFDSSVLSEDKTETATSEDIVTRKDFETREANGNRESSENRIIAREEISAVEPIATPVT
ncbi:MAG: hypothetical protein U9N02_09035, partial [Campylobacterota bacterium]|nr:hypothetical protein [Campylobacterota bacterium]